MKITTVVKMIHTYKIIPIYTLSHKNNTHTPQSYHWNTDLDFAWVGQLKNWHAYLTKEFHQTHGSINCRLIDNKYVDKFITKTFELQ